MCFIGYIITEASKSFKIECISQNIKTKLKIDFSRCLLIVIDKSYYQDLLLGSVPCFQLSCYLLNKNIHCEDKRLL